MGSTVLSVSLILLISFITNVVATHQNDSVTQCDCQQAVEDLLRVRTDRLFNRIALERQLKNQVERSGQLNEDLLDGTNFKTKKCLSSPIDCLPLSIRNRLAGRGAEHFRLAPAPLSHGKNQSPKSS